MNSIGYHDICEGFAKLGLIGERVEVHSSLKSFGYVEGGADTVVNAVIDSFKTVLMPAFCWDSNTVPSIEDRPVRNGCDYSFYDNWNKPLKPFIPYTAGIEKSMGIIPRTFLSRDGVKRSDHAWHSWAAFGEYANELVDNHPWDVTNLPIERLEKLDGFVVLIGVTFTSCTAIHIAEERAGRHPFIRWAVDAEGIVRRVRASGCAKGFDNLMSYCKDFVKYIDVGGCRIIAIKLKPLLERTSEIIVKNSEVTKCSLTCLRCRDAALGGPEG